MKSFSQQLSNAVVRINQQTEQSVRKVVLETFTSVIQMSPVSTGRFRGNWLPGIDAIPDGPIDTTDASGAKTIALATAEAMSLPLIDGRSLYLVNRVPYALNLQTRLKRLEAANKPQAGELPVLVVMPRDATPDERAAIRADVARREAAGQLVLLISTSDDPLAALVEACGP